MIIYDDAGYDHVSCVLVMININPWWFVGKPATMGMAYLVKANSMQPPPIGLSKKYCTPKTGVFPINGYYWYAW